MGRYAIIIDLVALMKLLFQYLQEKVDNLVFKENKATATVSAHINREFVFLDSSKDSSGSITFELTDTLGKKKKLPVDCCPGQYRIMLLLLLFRHAPGRKVKLEPFGSLGGERGLSHHPEG